MLRPPPPLDLGDLGEMMHVRFKFVAPAGLVLLAAACNQGKLVSGATCNNGSGVEEAPTATVVAAPNSGASNAAADAVPASAQDLINAMDVDPALQVSNVSFTGKPNQAAAFQGLGTLAPFK